MPIISREEVFERFRRLGFNSSHFVWNLSDLSFYETASGYVFGYLQSDEVTLLALEPLIPNSSEPLEAAWQEFRREVTSGLVAFVSIYKPFNEQLRRMGFKSVQIGTEPWITLSECVPTGNAGKGVRSARNQAIKAELFTEEWDPKSFESEPEKKAILSEIYHEWSSPRWMVLSGFTLATDPFAHSNIRRYFVVRSERRVEAYLIASPIPLTNSFYLEDLIMRRDAPRGTGELLTLDAMEALDRSGAHEASLGVVAVTNLGPAAAKDLPPIVRWFLVTLPKYLGLIYNCDGQETYRKRFKPQRWAEVYVSIHLGDSKISETRAWWRVFKQLGLAFQPKLRIEAQQVLAAFLKPLRRFPLSFSVAFISTLCFLCINQAGSLPQDVLSDYGFTAVVPVTQWFYRSLVSDYLYLDATHFYLCASALFVTLLWAEKTQRRSFLIPLFVATNLLDDVVNYAVLIWPFSHFQPALFEKLINVKDVGGSLILAFFAGLQLCQFRKARELIFSVLTLAVLLAVALTTTHKVALLINLNHLVFLVLGFVAGKLKFEWDRQRSRLASKGKTPVAHLPSPSAQTKKAA